MICRAPLTLLAGGLLVLGACSEKEPEPQTIPVPSAATVAADPGAASTAAAADTAAAAASAAPAASEAAPPPTTQKVGGSSIDGCCAALGTLAQSGKSPKAGTAYRLCSGLNKRVKAGEVTRQSAFTTIRGTLGDVAPPAQCR